MAEGRPSGSVKPTLQSRLLQNRSRRKRSIAKMAPLANHLNVSGLMRLPVMSAIASAT
jgi:hypothetical protein